MQRLRLLAVMAVCAAGAGCALDESGLGTAPLLPRDSGFGFGFDRPAAMPEAGGGDTAADSDAGVADAGAAADTVTGDAGSRDAVAAGDGVSGGSDGSDGGSAVDASGSGDGRGGAGDARDAGGCGACQPCETCSAGACRIDPASKWLIVCASAELSKTPPAGTGATWDRKTGDLGGADPDPFCEFEMPAGSVTVDTAGVTDTFLDTYTAAWGETVSPAGKTVKASDLMSATTTWRLWVGDDEGNGRGQIACQIQQPLAATALHDGQLTVQNISSCVSLTVKFVCQP